MKHVSMYQAADVKLQIYHLDAAPAYNTQVLSSHFDHVLALCFVGDRLFSGSLDNRCRTAATCDLHTCALDSALYSSTLFTPPYPPTHLTAQYPRVATGGPAWRPPARSSPGPPVMYAPMLFHMFCLSLSVSLSLSLCLSLY